MSGNTPQLADWGRAEDATGAPPDRASQGSASRSAMPAALGPRFELLLGAIKAEVIPRLVLTHGHGDPQHAARSPSGQAAKLLPLLLGDRLEAVIAHLHRLHDEGLTIEAIYLDILAPMARRLGELWLSDQCDFAQVTVGMLGLQRLMRHFALQFRGEQAAVPAERRVLLAAVPGEQHTFGVAMLAEFFRRDGWEVVDEPPRSLEELLDRVRCQPFHVVGLSLSRDGGLGALAGAIRAIRRQSCHGAVGILVGGAAFADHPRRAARVGADASAADPRQAVQQARNLLALLAAAR